MAYKNKEQIKEKNKEYRLSHSEYYKKYRAIHKEEWKEYNKKYLAKYRVTHKNQIKEYLKEYCSSDNYKKFNKERAEKYRKRNPLKYKARYTLRNAIVSNKITKPDKCSFCSNSLKIEAHHKDYNKPLEVIWLCKLCHIKEDKNCMV